MLKVYYGTDELKIRAEAFAAVPVGEDSLVRIEAETYEVGQLASFSARLSLFTETVTYLIDTPSQKKEFWEECIATLDALSQSAQTFIVIEESILAADKKKFELAGAELYEYKKTASSSFDAFSLANTLALKDRRALWLLLQAAKREGMSAEEIIGILWWQIKMLKLAGLTGSATEAGVKEYPYKKAKGALLKFKAGEVDHLLMSLLRLYHAGHAGQRDIDIALERWVLTGG